MHTPIGIGLIGVGRHGMRYARHIVQDLPQAMLTAVCRRNPDQPLDFPGANTVHLYGTPRELIADPSVQAVVVVVPPVYACEIARWAVQAHKPLLIEKPLAASHDDARAIAQAATAAQLH